MRKAIFLQNYQLINEHNAQSNATWSKGVTEYADLTSEEFEAMLGDHIEEELVNDQSLHLEASLKGSPADKADLAAEDIIIDWRPALSPIKN